MPRIRSPRRGSMQFWPRKRAAKMTARIRSWPSRTEQKLSGFAGYKVGMTHVIVRDNKPTSMTKGEELQIPVTIVECPPINVIAVMLYQKDAYGVHCVGQKFAEKIDPLISRSIPMPKKQTSPLPSQFDDVRVLASTQPSKTTIGKKAPELFELGVGGKTAQEKFAYATSLLGKEVPINDVFAAGQMVDTFSVTKGKGTQGPVKRFGIAIRHHKSEKTKRGPGSLGPWHGPRTFRAPHAGQMGLHQRMEHNKYILSMGTSPINPKSGIIRYGVVKNQYILIKGSVGGAPKRLVTMTITRRPSFNLPKEAPEILFTKV